MGAPIGNDYGKNNKGGGRPRNVDYSPFLKILEAKVQKKDIERITEKVKYQEIQWVDKKNKKGKIIGRQQKVVELEKLETTFASIWDALAWYVINGDKEMIKMVYNKFYPDVKQVEANINEQLDKEDMKQYTNEELDIIISEGKTIQKSRRNEASSNGESRKREGS